MAHLDAGRPARSFVLDEKERPIVIELQLLTHKPVFYVANVDESSLGKLDDNRYLTALRAYADRGRLARRPDLAPRSKRRLPSSSPPNARIS